MFYLDNPDKIIRFALGDNELSSELMDYGFKVCDPVA